ncbi:regulator of G-protein signaling 17-like isoform X2 [Lineus longissimus]|uniref:regulator of G-protein signaling 17-like isoform X2 n=1 Tax=Lineus longissimus TaxID=88925 RepID=UPI00315D5889
MSSSKWTRSRDGRTAAGCPELVGLRYLDPKQKGITLDKQGWMSGNLSPRGSTSVSENDNRMKNNRRTSNAQQQSQNVNQNTPPPSPAGSSDRSKACCFCWCCCCSCSWPTDTSKARFMAERMTRTAGNSDAPGPLLAGDRHTPSLEELKCWSESFDRLMSTMAGRKCFREFLRLEYSEENMLFWMACEELKSEHNAEAVEEKARLIYEDYISILSPKEVSLDSRVREIINRNMVDPTPQTFNEAQLQIYTLMHRDSYPRFLNSQVYKKLLQQGAKDTS